MPFKPVPGQKAEGYIWQADYLLHAYREVQSMEVYISYKLVGTWYKKLDSCASACVANNIPHTDKTNPLIILNNALINLTKKTSN